MDELQPIPADKTPCFRLNTGASIPAIGFGTFGSDHVSPELMANSVETAIRLGYRHIDCAAVYANEKAIGNTLQKLYREGLVCREDLWLTSKIWNDHHGQGDVLLSCAQTLKDLQTSYLDLMLIHWPFPNYHPPGCDVDSRNPDSRPYIHENFTKTYRQLERLADMGLVRHIGISNVTIPKLRLILRDCRLKPAVNEMELHPHFQQPELFAYAQENGLLNIGYCPLGSPNRPERDKTSDDTIDMADPVIVDLAVKHGVHPAAICLKWAIAHGHAAIPMSTSPKNIRANLAAVVGQPLSPDEMAQIALIDKNCRLVKGHVFLWNNAKDWTDLWDINGEITV